jgi:hypothetical protein
MRRARWIIVLLVAVVVAAIVAAFVLVRPGLDEDRARVDDRWAPLRPALVDRYAKLGSVGTALRDAGAADRTVTVALEDALDRWRRFALLGPKHTDPGAEAAAANELEGLARRVRANYIGSEKLKSNAALTAAIGAFNQAVVSPPAVRAYNRAVRAYEDDRSGFFEGIVAGGLGYDPRPVLLIST